MIGPRRKRVTKEFEAVLRLKVHDAGTTDLKYWAELFVDGDDKMTIQQLLLATGFDVSLKDLKEREK